MGPWPVDEVGEDGLDDGVAAVGDIGVPRGLGRVGEEGMEPVGREQLITGFHVLKPDPAHHQARGDRLLTRGERGVVHLGDLGIGDQLPGVGVNDGAGVAHRGPCVVGNRVDPALDGGILTSTTENWQPCFTTAFTTAALPYALAVEQPEHLDQVTQVLAIRQKRTPAPDLGHVTGDEVKALLAEPGTASARAVSDTVLLALAYDTAARVQELCDLDVADIRRGANPMTVAIRGKGSKIRYVPVMEPTARLVADHLERRDPHTGLGADADPLFYGPTTPG